jgi:hypothetical protein
MITVQQIRQTFIIEKNSHLLNFKPSATDDQTNDWLDGNGIQPGLTESDFDLLPSGFYACYTGYLPATRIELLPTTTKGCLARIIYQQTTDMEHRC